MGFAENRRVFLSIHSCGMKVLTKNKAVSGHLSMFIETLRATLPLDFGTEDL